MFLRPTGSPMHFKGDVDIERGSANVVTILMVIGLVVVGYLGWVYVPLFYQHLEVKQRCQESLNATWLRRDPRHTQEDVLRRVRAIDTVEKVAGGELLKVPAIDPGDFIEVWLDETARPNILAIDFSYEREVPLPLLGRTHTFFFSARCERALE